MKNDIFVEFQGRQIDTNAQMNRLKEIWKEQGGKVKDLDDVKLYINVEQGVVHYVVNGDTANASSFEII